MSSDSAAVRILLIDDDRELTRLMRDYLAPQGFAVSICDDGPSGLREALATPFDVVTLDVMLPGLDGFEVLRQLRRRSKVPLIMLTARTATDDRVGGLEAGADDYLPKPFQPAELVARIRAVLRRIGPEPTEVLEVNGVRLIVANREASCGGVALPLTTAELDILELLMRRAGLAVSRDDLAAARHQRLASPFERGTDVHVSNLRRKLLAAGVDAIKTVRGVGYLFARG